jgi:hypothetical protein
LAVTLSLLIDRISQSISGYYERVTSGCETRQGFRSLKDYRQLQILVINEVAMLHQPRGHCRFDDRNNAAERAIRPIAIGRKNWMFAGSDTGGQRAATIYTIIETAPSSRPPS